MSAVAVAHGPRSFGETELIAGCNKLINIRDGASANNVLSAVQIKQAVTLANAPSQSPGPQSNATVSSQQASNGTTKPAQTANIGPTKTSAPNPQQARSNGAVSKPPPGQPLPSVSRPSGIDPIFLTKSNVLVRAEINQKRQRLERALEEQVSRLQRHKAADHDALPDFDVTEVLKKAQELVKPFKMLNSSHTDRNASSSDSFDENTFYSSQIDESTTTEEVSESRKASSKHSKLCNHYRKGEHCKYGESCIFSHDPVLKRKEESQASAPNRTGAGQQGQSHQEAVYNKGIIRNNSTPKPPVAIESSTLELQASRERQDRIARLEAELRNAKAEQEDHPHIHPHEPRKTVNETQEELAYSPPEPDEYGRDMGLRQARPRQAALVSHRPGPSAGQQTTHEYGRTGRPQSPLPNNVRVITSHIRSPVAPQPSRVSPLAVAKVPQIAQVQREYDDDRRMSRASNAETSSAAQSPRVNSQTQNAKKRRRGLDPEEQARNVLPRTDFGSPVVRVKEEPVSPPPFGIAESAVRQSRPDQAARPLYRDMDPTQQRNQQPMFYRPRLNDRPSYGQLDEGRGPQTPTSNRIITRNDQQYVANEDIGFRRVVTAPRQTKAPRSPSPYAGQYSAPQPRAARAASQVYFSPAGQGVPYQHQAIAQPAPGNYVQRIRSPSPGPQFVPQSTDDVHESIMPPPTRRIVVDQWGNRFIEAPVPIERQASVAPLPRANDFDPHYDRVTPRGMSVSRQSQFVEVNDEGRFLRREASPTTNGFFEVPAKRIVDSSINSFGNDPYSTGSKGPLINDQASARPPGYYQGVPERDTRIVRMRSVRPLEHRHEDGIHSDERIVSRMQSVHPVRDPYEVPSERLVRVQSVRPEQPRIINLGQDQGRLASRPMSVLPESASAANGRYIVEGPAYQHDLQRQNRSFIEEAPDNRGFYVASEDGSTRILRRV